MSKTKFGQKHVTIMNEHIIGKKADFLTNFLQDFCMRTEGKFHSNSR